MSAPTRATRGAPIVLSGVGLDFGNGRARIEAVKDVDFSVRAGEFVSLLGPSGCGKSSLVGAIAGFTPVASGTIEVDQRRVTAPSHERAVVFQSHTLFPWKTVLANVEFGLRLRGVPRRARREAAERILGEVGLAEFRAHYPDQLSGGMQQRVNLARALVTRPRVLLLDEPFCALDAQTRIEMQKLLLALWHEHGMTVVFVTHDVDEAVFLSDRVLVLTERPGHVLSELDVGLPRPRSHALFTIPEFVSLKRAALDALLSVPTRRASMSTMQEGASRARAAPVPDQAHNHLISLV